MLILPTMPETVLEQQVNLLKTQTIMQELIGNRNKLTLENNFSYTLKRLLNTDEFTIEVDAIKKNLQSDSFLVPAININNDDKTIFNYSNFNFKKQMEIYLGNSFKLNTMILNHTKFKNLKMSAVGVDSGNSAVSSQSLRTIANWQIFTFPQLSISDFNHILHLRIPKTIKVETEIRNFGATSNLHNSYYSQVLPGDYQLDIKYLNLFLKANLPSWTNPTQSLVDIYGYDESDENSKFIDDIDFFNTGNLKSTSVPSGLKTQFNYDYDPNHQYQINPWKKATYLGNITSQDSVYYDYHKEDVVKGFAQNHVFGDLIPYNFSGQYQWTLNLSFNETIKNLLWKINSDPIDPLLHPTNGQIRLALKSDILPKKALKHTLTYDDLMIIRKYDDISLEGIKRFG